eukprot:scaffold535_cov260-Pinguiococcus_pyrenoidosus.AAC.39
MASSDFPPDLFGAEESQGYSSMLELEPSFVDPPVPIPFSLLGPPFPEASRAKIALPSCKAEPMSDSQSTGITDSEGAWSAPSSDLDDDPSAPGQWTEQVLTASLGGSGFVSDITLVGCGTGANGHAKPATPQYTFPSLDFQTVCGDDEGELVCPDDLPFLTDIQETLLL